MTSKELMRALLKVKDADTEVRITDTHGSFNVGVLTVEQENEEGGEVIIVAEPHPQL